MGSIPRSLSAISGTSRKRSRRTENVARPESNKSQLTRRPPVPRRAGRLLSLSPQAARRIFLHCVGVDLVEQLLAAHRGNMAGVDPDHRRRNAAQLAGVMTDIDHRHLVA